MATSVQVPETAMNKDNFPLAGKNDVWFAAGQWLRG
jgi:hypothetical protein